ncbi:inositol polyphosphate-4-phosphatase type I A isoform X1 [Lucilia sericata]|uniref:inositol polyphosphate-4-phosphatase type I A isoform X1 n=2 Tax=Lucilia sericata TaxID=13632 RepID=UPI0018A87D75|nr:inositol polyphosphate-4-phosphatase type I A isoform X1 [Lucilia sericata]
MRFNKAELATLASNPTIKFEKEGLLIITERQEGFFRKAEVNYPRWCKLRGNLLFYLKDHDPLSQPAGVLVLENCRPLIRSEEREFDGFVFILEFEGSLPQRISTRTAKERLDWVKSIQLASYSYLNKQIQYLEDQIAITMGNRIEKGLPLYAPANDATLLAGLLDLNSAKSSKANVEEDLSEIPICESALSCDNLPCADNGRLPCPRVVCAVLISGDDIIWRDYARTEIIENCKNPQFLCTMSFKNSDGFNADTPLRFTVYDVREKVSSTSVPIGYAEVVLGAIQDATRFRIPLRSVHGECGFINIASWAPDTDKQLQPPPRSTTQVFEQQTKGHRRTQSLPPKLGVKLFVPFQGSIQRIFANPKIHTYRLNSSLGADISVHETLMESKLCFSIPHQLLSIWILREKELLQEISGMGELGGEWRRKQMDLLDKHLKLLNDYSQAKQNLQQIIKEEGTFFKKSSVKTDESLEFIPVNLHLQRMWSQNDSLNRTGVLDIITVGAFTRHAGKMGKTGGLIKLLQETKESPSKFEVSNNCKVQAANDAVQAIKQLRKEIVEIMSQLLALAKQKNQKGMMPLCNEMVTKTKTLLNIWEPNLVEEAFSFIEQHRIIEEPDNVLMPMSPFRKITQQLNDLELKSPELEDFSTPVIAPPDLWPRAKTPTTNLNYKLVRSNSLTQLKHSPSLTLDIDAIHNLQHTVRAYNEQLQRNAKQKSSQCKIQSQNTQDENEEATFQSLPVNLNSNIEYNENNFVEEDEDQLTTSPIKLIDLDESPPSQAKEGTLNCSKPIKTPHIMANARTDYGYELTSCTVFASSRNARFLDTKMMSTSPSANYYRPTEEPEPLDLTQLNIEASVMCLVSKIKFLCGRCGSPAIRLRHPKVAMKRSGFSNNPVPDVVDNGNSQATSCVDNKEYAEGGHSPNGNSNGLNLDLTQSMPANDNPISSTKKGNKFTDGLDLSLTTDWASELRPSMRKLRHAMDGLLKTARLMHSVQRLQQNMDRISMNLEIMYRRDVCFSQALTALVSALMAKLWGNEITHNFIKILCDLGPLAYFEGLLSLYGSEIDMWGDMCIAIEDLLAVEFILVRCNMPNNDQQSVPIPRINGSRQSLCIHLPIPEYVYALLPTKQTVNFKVTPVFFNIGINEKATLAEAVGRTREQHRSNWDNYVRLKQYYSRFRKLPLQAPETPSKNEPHKPASELLLNILNFMEEQLKANVSKNVKILHLAEDACRLMSGLRFTSCKSAKDRTGMSVTLEQCRVLVQEFQLPAKSVPYVLNTMRSEGCRMDNVYKNIDKRKYAFNLPQVLSLPAMYRPPVGAYGKAET